MLDDPLIGLRPFGRQDLDDELRRDVEKASRLRPPIVLGVRDEDDVGASHSIGIRLGEDSNLTDHDKSQVLRTSEAVESGAHVVMNDSIVPAS